MTNITAFCGKDDFTPKCSVVPSILVRATPIEIGENIIVCRHKQ